MFIGWVSSISAVYSQIDTLFFNIVEKITIEGNKKTIDKTILREMDFGEGDTLMTSKLKERFEVNENQIYNTGLFNEVSISFTKSPLHQERITVKINVVERWYIFVFPVFELADRNFNVWWVEQNRDLKRTKYGAITYLYNRRGRNETLSLSGRWGYNRKIIFKYSFPFIDQKKIYGLSTRFVYIADREIKYNTFENKFNFYEHSSFASSRLESGISVTRRKAIRYIHTLQTNYYRNTVVDSVVTLNPNYFLNGKKSQQMLELRYKFEDDTRDIRKYPLKGHYFKAEATKLGLGVFDDVNAFWLDAHYSYYRRILPKTYWASNVKARTSLIQKLPFANAQRIGYRGTFIRGYELYVIDGEHFGFLRNAVKYQLVNTSFRNPLTKMEEFEKIPFQIYLKLYNELALVHNQIYTENNPLNNGFLMGNGVGIDIFTSYDSLFSIEYNINHLRESAFFLQINITWDM